MPLNVREISIKCAIGCFFLIAFVGWFAGLEPLACSQRAALGAFAAYLFMTVLVRIINQIMIGAYIKFRMKEQQRKMSEYSS